MQIKKRADRAIRRRRGLSAMAQKYPALPYYTIEEVKSHLFFTKQLEY
jgi:hypothetical protein